MTLENIDIELKDLVCPECGGRMRKILYSDPESYRLTEEFECLDCGLTTI